MEASGLDGRVAVLSPHLDDAAFSLGAAIHAAVRRGASVRVVTVLGCDPASSRPSGSWDRRAGFATEGEAAAARRREDAAAWELLGAEPITLAFGDETYGRGDGDDAIWAEIAPLVTGFGTILAPGWPLGHPDHRWLSALARARCPAASLGWYREQPYAVHQADPCGDGSVAAGWVPLFSSAADRRRKRRAIRRYRSQLPLLGGDAIIRRVGRSERRCGGEAVAWAVRR